MKIFTKEDGILQFAKLKKMLNLKTCNVKNCNKEVHAIIINLNDDILKVGFCKEHFTVPLETKTPFNYELDFSGATFSEGDKVTYLTDHEKEHGIVKSVKDEKHAFVVYKCGEDWENYKNYTAARTKIKDLIMGWV